MQFHTIGEVTTKQSTIALLSLLFWQSHLFEFVCTVCGVMVCEEHFWISNSVFSVLANCHKYVNAHAYRLLR